MLSEEKIASIRDAHETSHPVTGDWSVEPFTFARAIESAVLAEQAKAGPVAYGLFWKNDGEEVLQFPVCATEEEAKSDLHMYADGDQAMMTIRPLGILHPAPAPEGMVMVPREPTEAMLDAMRIGSRKDYPSDELCRVRFAALIAAAEKEQSNAG